MGAVSYCDVGGDKGELLGPGVFLLFPGNRGGVLYCVLDCLFVLSGVSAVVGSLKLVGERGVTRDGLISVCGFPGWFPLCIGERLRA